MFNRIGRSFAIGVLLAGICVAFWNYAAAVEHSADARQQKKAVLTLPPADTYTIDPVHTFAFFGAWHHVVGLVRGRFEKVEGTITVSQDPAACGVDITIDTTRISTQDSERDEDLRDPISSMSKNFPP